MNADVTQLLKDLFDSSELNRLPPEYGGHRLFKEPVIGVPVGNDPIFAKFKEVVTPTHLTPAEMWSKSASPKRRGQDDLPIRRPLHGQESDGRQGIMFIRGLRALLPEAQAG